MTRWDPPAAAVIPTEEGDFWHATVAELVAREAITALVRELALQSQLVARDEDHWMLRVERESLNQPASRERLKAALQAAGHAVNLSVEVGMRDRQPGAPQRRRRRRKAACRRGIHPQRPLCAGHDARLWRENRPWKHQASEPITIK